MSLLRDLSYVQDIVGAARLVKDFIGTMNEAGFLNDLKTQSSVIRQLEIIDEASKMVSDGFKSQHPGVPWRKMTDMRNILAHMYNEVDVPLVWNVVTGDLVSIAAYLSLLLVATKS